MHLIEIHTDKDRQPQIHVRTDHWEETSVYSKLGSLSILSRVFWGLMIWSLAPLVISRLIKEAFQEGRFVQICQR